MKKAFKTLGFVIGLPLLYYFISSLVSGFFIGFYFVVNQVGSDSFNVLEVLTPVMYHLSLVSDLIMLLVLFLIYLGAKEKLFKSCRFNRIQGNTIPYIIIFSIGLTMLILFLMGVFSSLLPSIFESYSIVGNAMLATHNSVLSLIIVIVLIPIFEEIFFRGVIFGFLRDNYKFPIALIVQALVFGILHGNLVQSVYAFILGLFLGAIFYYTNSLYASILSHITYNLFGILILPLIVSSLQGFSPILVNIIFVAIALILLIFGSIKLINTLKKQTMF
ncbi:type II CAAX endopeptidase family protein [Clostridium sp. LIBA-8841]|uniref:CPBP family intramembrane glutamic endopeptidase n=1 Tax=Clostridium sp. LIBA-8841 TaxID=2987530 RepID=UPI002AC6B202|nr:type II CAAX endopeptidase family protein [Clostridium sp. LIBA-8841]MDZ5255160.1 CPBP family intramembrane metalloprotease [Clostridium sp. LIBA-8841]